MNLQIGREQVHWQTEHRVQRLSAVIGQAVALIREDVSIYPTDVSLINTRRSLIPVSASKIHLQMAFKHPEKCVFILVL